MEFEASLNKDNIFWVILKHVCEKWDGRSWVSWWQMRSQHMAIHVLLQTHEHTNLRGLKATWSWAIWLCNFDSCLIQKSDYQTRSGCQSHRACTERTKWETTCHDSSVIYSERLVMNLAIFVAFAVKWLSSWGLSVYHVFWDFMSLQKFYVVRILTDKDRHHTIHFCVKLMVYPWVTIWGENSHTKQLQVWTQIWLSCIHGVVIGISGTHFEMAFVVYLFKYRMKCYEHVLSLYIYLVLNRC